MSTTLTATKTSKTKWAQISKTTTLPSAAHVLVHFFVGTAPLRREIAKFHPHIDKVKNRRQLSLLLSLLNLNIFITNSTPGGVRLNLTEASSTLIFFLRFQKKKSVFTQRIRTVFAHPYFFKASAVSGFRWLNAKAVETRQYDSILYTAYAV